MDETGLEDFVNCGFICNLGHKIVVAWKQILFIPVQWLL